MNRTTLSRREFVAASAAAMALGLTAGEAPAGEPAQAEAPAGAPTSAAARRPNLVLFLPDQLRAESIGCYGHPVVQTPHIDRLAAQGVRFSYCAAHPLCVVSRCSMMTGWPSHVRGHRSFNHLLSRSDPNLFRYLKAAGYDVYWFGKNDLLEHDCFQDSVTAWEFFAAGPEWDAKENPWPLDDPMYYSFLFKPGKDRRDYPDYARVRAGIQVLEREHARPFCLFLPLWFPHPPFTGPKDFYEMYRPQGLPPLRPAGSRKPRFYEEIRRSRRLDRLKAGDLLKINAVYLGMVSYTDWLLGELMAALERTGHAADTAVIFCSDHGEWAGDYGLVEKWSSAMDDPLVRVPLVIRLPGGGGGRVVDGPVQLYDVMATCLDLAGVKAQHTHFARSLLPQLGGAAGDPNAAVFLEGGYNANEPQCFEDLPLKPDHIYYPKIHLQMTRPETITRATMIRTADHKLVVRPDGESEFYDLKRDPRELNNVYGDGSYATLAEDLRQRMLAWYVRTSDVTPPDLGDARDMPPGNFR
jgi:choline-sulfatase